MIELKHSSTIIHNYTLGDNTKLERILSVWDEATFSVSWKAFYYIEKENKLIIPRGFDVNYLQYLFPEKELYINKKTK